MPTTPYPSDAWFDIATLVNVAQPQSILTVGDFETAFLADYCAQKKLIGQVVKHTHYAENPEPLFELQARFDLAIVANLIEHQDKNFARRIVSRLRDVSSKQFCVCLPLLEEGWQLHDMLALGLQRVAEYDADQQRFGLFKYNLSEYKKTPDWLNADNWANPEMWGKYSW